MKYLCYHYGFEETCYVYLGSGRYWKNHIRKHGKNITTQILSVCNSQFEARKKGLMWSKELDVVNSQEFANLIVEDARTSFKHMQDVDRQKAIKNRQKRRAEAGLTELEIANHKRLGSIKFEMTDKRKTQYDNRTARLKNKQFTEAEKMSYIKKSEDLKGKTMAERTGIEGYISPNKGKTLKQITGKDYQHPHQIKYIIMCDRELVGIFCITDMLNILMLSHSIIKTLRSGGIYCVKRQKNTKHKFLNDSKLTASLGYDAGVAAGAGAGDAPSGAGAPAPAVSGDAAAPPKSGGKPDMPGAPGGMPSEAAAPAAPASPSASEEAF